MTAPRFDGDLSTDGSTGADAPLPIPSVELRALGDDMFRAEVGQALSGTVFKMTTLIGGGVGSGCTGGGVGGGVGGGGGGGPIMGWVCARSP